MLRSSLGFHTITLFLRLNYGEVEKLIKHFCTYRKHTGLIRMLIPQPKPEKGWREYTPMYNGRRIILPLHLKIIYCGKDQGIRWVIRSDRRNEMYSEYTVEATINPKILGGVTDYVTASNCNDLDTAIRKFNRISKGISPVLGTFENYTFKRIDYCLNFDVDEITPGCTSEQVMNLIRRGDVPPHFKERTEYDSISHRMKSKPDSFYLICKSTTINCYRKSVELQRRIEKGHRKGSSSVTQEMVDAAQNIIRFEVQCKYPKVYNLSRRTKDTDVPICNKLQNLFGYHACLEIINHYYGVTIGAGDWFSLSAAQKIIKLQRFNAQKTERLMKVLREVNQCRSLASAKKAHQGSDLAAFKQTLKDLADIGINPVTIPREWGIAHIPNLLHSFNDMDLARVACPELRLI